MNAAHLTTEQLIRELVRRLLCGPVPEPDTAKPTLEWVLRFDAATVIFNGDFRMNMKDDSNPIGISVANWLDSRGKKAKVDPNTPVTYTSSDENLVKITTNAAGDPAIAPGALDGVDADDSGVIGTAVITASADADLGEGVKAVNAVGSVVVVAGDAAVGELTFGQPDA